MPHLTRALRACVMLAVPTSVFAQSTKGPTVFSPAAQVGTVNLRAAVVLGDYSVKPLPLLKVVAQRTDRPDSAITETDLEGRSSMTLRVGTYTLRAKTEQPVAGRAYAWAVRVVVRQNQPQSVQLTNSNASVSDSVATTPAVVAEAKPAPRPAAPPPQPASSPTPTNKVVAKVDPPKPAPTPLPAPAAAQASPFAPGAASRPIQPAPHARTNTSGLMLGLSFDASSIRSDDLNSSRESGPGAAALVGWGVTKNFALLLDASGARISSLAGDYDLGHVDLGGRWHFVNRSAFVPFVEVGYAGRVATKQDAILSDEQGNTYTGDLSILGGGVSFGGGLEYFVTPGIALGGAFKWTTGQFTQVKFDNVTVDGLQVDATSARFNMGFTWYPMGKR
jgi:outer membrane protein with beta-barrel domain